MRRLLFSFTILLTLACGGGGSADLGTDPAVSAVAARFASVDCAVGSTDLDRSWCPVQSAGHGPFVPPEATQIRMGLTLSLRPGEEPKDVILDRTTVSALFIGGGGAKILDVRPSNDQEQQDLVTTVFSIAEILKGMHGTTQVAVTGDLQSYLQGQGTDLHPLTADEHGASISGAPNPTDIERIEGQPWGAAYVVVETAPDGVFVSVFPDADLAVKP